MSTRRLAALLLTAAVGALPGGCGPAEESARRPNVLLLVADTLRAEHLSTYGYAWPTSPHLDELAARGVTFLDCTAQASWTMPSMISLMTAQPIFSTLYRIPERFPVLAERFEEAGYRTAAYVANSLVSPDAGFDRGIQDWDGRPQGGAKWRADELERRALAFLDAADDERPWFLWLHAMDTHAPYAPPEVPWRRAPAELFTEAEQAGIKAVLDDAADDERKALSAQIAELAGTVDRYDGEVAALDAFLGRLLAELERRGVAEDTYVVLVADHGETLFSRRQIASRFEQLRRWREHRGEALRLEDHLKMEHDGLLYEELVRTPFVLAGPGVPRGRREEALVANLDVGPTLLGLCGLPSDLGTGRDLSAALRADAPVPDAPWATSSCRQALAAKLPGGRKLLVPLLAVETGFDLTPRVYDLRADPEERAPTALDDEAAAGEPTADASDVDTLRAARERLERALTNGPFVSFSGTEADPETLEKLKELGYVR